MNHESNNFFILFFYTSPPPWKAAELEDSWVIAVFVEYGRRPLDKFLFALRDRGDPSPVPLPWLNELCNTQKT